MYLEVRRHERRKTRERDRLGHDRVLNIVSDFHSQRVRYRVLPSSCVDCGGNSFCQFASSLSLVPIQRNVQGSHKKRRRFLPSLLFPRALHSFSISHFHFIRSLSFPQVTLSLSLSICFISRNIVFSIILYYLVTVPVESRNILRVMNIIHL